MMRHGELTPVRSESAFIPLRQEPARCKATHNTQHHSPHSTILPLVKGPARAWPINYIFGPQRTFRSSPPFAAMRARHNSTDAVDEHTSLTACETPARLRRRLPGVEARYGASPGLGMVQADRGDRILGT